MGNVSPSAHEPGTRWGTSPHQRARPVHAGERLPGGVHVPYTLGNASPSVGEAVIPLVDAPLAEDAFQRGGQLGTELDLEGVAGSDPDGAVRETDLERDRDLADVLDEQVA